MMKRGRKEKARAGWDVWRHDCTSMEPLWITLEKAPTCRQRVR